MREGANVVPWLPKGAVIGVGSVLVPPRHRALLLALDASLYPQWLAQECPSWWYRQWWLGQEFPSWWCRRQWRRHSWRRSRMIVDPERRHKHLWHSQLIPLMGLAVPLGVLLTAKASSFDWTDIPQDAMVLLIEPPKPLLRSLAIRSGQSRGSIGLAVELEGAGASAASGYTTAGHVIRGELVRQELRWHCPRIR
jgi:hypothetical protein